MTQFQDARVTTRTIFVSITQLVKQTLQSCHARGACRTGLAALATQRSLLGVARMEEARCLPAQVKRAWPGIVPLETAGFPRQGNGPLHKRTQLFRFWQSSYDPFVARVNE